MRKPCYLFFVLWCICNNPVYGHLPDSLEQHMDAILQRYIGSDRPGATIGIIDNGKLVFMKGYGMANLAGKKQNGSGITYKVASVSKQFTAATIALLIQRQQLSLEDDIRKYLPEIPDYGKRITIGHLLYHTSGIRDYMVLMWLCGKSFEDPFTNKDAIDIIARQSSLHFTTGNRCVYSNSNYILLAAILEKLTGSPLYTYARKNLFAPLKMNGSGFDDAQPIPHLQLALSYQQTDSGYIAFKNSNHAIGDGGMFTTLPDLVKWDQTFYDSTAISAPLLRRGQLDNGNILSYGMGIMTGVYRGLPVQMHPGAFLGYRAEILRFPGKRITIICLGNTEDMNPELITKSIADVYIFQQKNIPTAHTPKYNAPPSDVSLTGKYEVAPQVFIDIKQENNQLTGQVSGQPKQILYKEDAQVYNIGTTGDKVMFQKDSSGHPSQLTVIQKTGNTIAPKLVTVTQEQLTDYAGSYYCDEQKATYTFYMHEGILWFKVGTNPPVAATIFKKYDRIYFSYRELERATIEFNRNATGQIAGFTLGAGRVSGLQFVKN